MGVLAVLAAGAGACERENPGFKLKGTGDGPDETTGLLTTSVSGPTVTSDSDTTVPTSSTTEDLTTDGPDATGSSSTTGQMTDPVDTTTTGELLPWDNTCVDAEDIVTVEYEVLGDTFFMFSDEGVGTGCDIGSGESIGGFFCSDLGFGKVGVEQVFNYPVDGLVEDALSVFAVSFAPKTIDDGVEEVPTAAFIDLTLLVAFDRLDESDEEVPFRLVRFDAADEWVEGNNADEEVCGTDDSSYRCRACIDNNPSMCMVPWAGGAPFTDANVVLKEFAVGEADPAALVEIALETGEREALKGPHQGFVIVPRSGLQDGVLAIRTKEFHEAAAPRLVARYCKDPNKR